MIASELRHYLPEAATYAGILATCFVAIGLYERTAVGDMRIVVIRMLTAFAAAFALLAIVAYVVPELLIWRSGLVIAMAVSFVGVLALRLAFLWSVDRNAFRRRVLVLGDPGPTAELRRIERQIGLAPFRIVCTLQLGERGTTENTDDWLLELCRAYGVEEVVVAATERRGRLPMQALLRCRLAGLGVRDYHDFCERETGRIDLERLQPGWLAFSDGFERTRRDLALKRGIDLVLALLVLIATAPLMLLAALLVRLEDGGPVFYRQQRVGRDGLPFEIVKFRSMRIDAESEGPRWAAQGDARVTRVGRLLRRTRIDELPQLLNVLKGEMSFVGPRPERPVFVAQITEALPYFPERHRLPPGLAGWAQLNHPYAASLADARAKLEYDMYYIKNWSLFLDFVILAQTLRVVVWGKGAR